jgi:hypothetical protein
MVFLHKYESICTQNWLPKNWRDSRVIGIANTTTTPVCYPGSYGFLTTTNTLEGAWKMHTKNYVIMEHKPTPKQIPLFEEQDDGNLIPYVKET